MAKPRVAILGATGYIGRSLLYECVTRGLEIFPFVRDIPRARNVFQCFGIEVPHLWLYSELGSDFYDIIVNATGAGSPRAQAADPAAVFRVTETMDELLRQQHIFYPLTRIFHLSSGAVYGLRAGAEIGDDTESIFDPNRFKAGDGYAIAKLASEAKHRLQREYAIIDLRMFSFFSQFADLEEKFLLSEMTSAVVNKTVFKTSADNFIRDYATAKGLLDLILFFYYRDPANLAVDVQTRSPISKLQLLGHFQSNFDLKAEEIPAVDIADNPTGRKNMYFSRSTALSKLGFSPEETSLQGIDREMRALLAK